MEVNEVWVKRNKARDLIVKALENLSPGDHIDHNTVKCGGEKYHSVLTTKQIDSGVQAFITLNTMSAGSQGDFDLYRLLHKYILDPNIREEINKILRCR